MRVHIEIDFKGSSKSFDIKFPETAKNIDAIKYELSGIEKSFEGLSYIKTQDEIHE